LNLRRLTNTRKLIKNKIEEIVKKISPKNPSDLVALNSTILLKGIWIDKMNNVADIKRTIHPAKRTFMENDKKLATPPITIKKR